jgi:hypothetical protein
MLFDVVAVTAIGADCYKNFVRSKIVSRFWNLLFIWNTSVLGLIEDNLRFWQPRFLTNQPTNQPTYNLRAESCAERYASSLVRLNHSCIQDALLEIGNRSLYTITGDVLTLTGVMSRLKALTWYHWWICFCWGMILTNNSSLVGCLGVEPRIGVALYEGLDEFWGGDRSGWSPLWSGVGGPCPFSFIPWHLPYNWGKARKISVRVFKIPDAEVNIFNVKAEIAQSG